MNMQNVIADYRSVFLVAPEEGSSRGTSLGADQIQTEATLLIKLTKLKPELLEGLHSMLREVVDHGVPVGKALHKFKETTVARETPKRREQAVVAVRVENEDNG